MAITIINKSKNPTPKKETEGASGYDLRANLEENIAIRPGRRELIPTGIFLTMYNNRYEAQIRPRSGLAYKYGVTVLNAPGTIDSDYRGEVKVLLINHGTDDFIVKNGDRIAQMVFSLMPCADVKEENESFEFIKTERGDKGFGSTGVS